MGEFTITVAASQFFNIVRKKISGYYLDVFNIVVADIKLNGGVELLNYVGAYTDDDNNIEINTQR